MCSYPSVSTLPGVASVPAPCAAGSGGGTDPVTAAIIGAPAAVQSPSNFVRTGHRVYSVPNYGIYAIGARKNEVRPDGYAYHQQGMKVFDGDDNHLRVYQRRGYLPPLYYGSGCITPYCTDGSCRTSVPLKRDVRNVAPMAYGPQPIASTPACLRAPPSIVAAQALSPPAPPLPVGAC